jgi:hypothetical protein
MQNTIVDRDCFLTTIFKDFLIYLVEKKLNFFNQIGNSV